MHAGTNNLRDSTPEEVAEKVVKTFKRIKQKNSKSQLAYSSIFRRKGNAANGMNVKVFQTNKILKEELMLQDIDFIDNDNILYGNICDDGLHINQGGARRFASTECQEICRVLVGVHRFEEKSRRIAT